MSAPPATDERAARHRDAQRRRALAQRQLQRLLDAYEAEALTLDELRSRRTRVEARLAALEREQQRLAAEDESEEQFETLCARAEEFRAAIARGLGDAPFALRRQLVELLVDRVVVDAPDVEIRYVIPLSGTARRNGVLRPRHRTAQQGSQAAHRCRRDRSEPCRWRPPGRGDPCPRSRAA